MIQELFGGRLVIPREVSSRLLESPMGESVLGGYIAKGGMDTGPLRQA